MTDLSAAWREAAVDFRFAWRPLVVTDLLYKGLATMVLVPAVGVILRAFLYLSGNDVHADQDILLFFLSPLGLTTVVVIAGAFIAVGAMEIAGLMVIAMAAREHRHVTVIGALRFALTRIWTILRVTMRLVIRVLVIAAPVLALAGLIAWWLLTEHDINYYLSNQPPVFVAAAIIIGALLAAMLFVLVRRLVGWVYVLPLVLFENVDTKRVFALSETRAASHRRMLALIVVSWIAASLLASTLVLGAVRVVGLSVTGALEDQVPLLMTALAALLVLWFTANLLVHLFTTCFLALLIAHAYRKWGCPNSTDRLAALAVPETTQVGVLASRPLWVLFGAAAVLAVGTGASLLEHIDTDHEVLVIAHRGAAGHAPENTLASVEEAIKRGTDWVEIDVQETADGTVVVIHDSDLMKIAGVATKVWDGRYQELSELDIGSWFDPGFADQRLATLRQVLELARGRAGVTIELKYYGHDQRLEERVVEIVESMGMAADLEVMSLEYDAVRKMRELRPRWTLGLLTARALGDLTTADADFLAVSSAIASPGFIRSAHAAGKRVYVWTVNDLASMSRMVSRGADGLITDYPGLARQLLEQHAKLNSVQRLLMDLALRIGIEIEPVDIVSETAGADQPPVR